MHVEDLQEYLLYWDKEDVNNMILNYESLSHT